MNDRLVSVTPSLRRKLKSAFQQQFKSTEDFLLKWNQQADTLSKSPSEADIENILYSHTQSTCVYWIINGVCQLLLNRPYRDNSLKQVPLELKHKLRDKFHEQFKVRGQIAWGEFGVAWGRHLNDPDPPRHQTLRSFFANEERDSCEHWLVNGLCQLLLDCSFDEWMEQGLENCQKLLPGEFQSPIPNPLSSITPQIRLDTILWVGRTALVAKLEHQLQEDCRVLSIVGITGIGKTSLAMRLTLESSVAIRFQELYTVSVDRTLSNFLEVARQLLGESIAQEEKLQKEPDLLVQAVVNKLRSQPCLVILDMVEEILESDGEGSHQFSEPIFTKFFEQIVKAEQMPSRIVLTSQDLPPTIAEGRYPSRVHIERLKGLEETEALELFESWDVRIRGEVDLENLKRIIRVYEGHPLALRVIAGEIRMPPYNGDVQAYWYDYGDEITAVERMKGTSEEKSREDKPRIDRYSIGLTDLVKKRIDRTFTRLYKAEPLACLMLCQGAVYRRAVERSAWLLAIAEHSHEAQASAFQSLQRRFLLEEEYTERKVLYRPHSLIRRVALDRLAQLEVEVLPL
ncbi:AAA family ATPase [Scytonema sp. UIC 10036]|uniref:ATP-binding protein n=1 Tax=Scytonema sp. UIC 10036 TaxID=2304196 RepID=UPI0012DA1BAD|nr:ATP-binding protein [Scytonema sp. UIC 10036]MUG93390.1 AAA family ATPase [Scytonema sp. UIC 10036]